jgi:phenylpropionate dioxygenase-like ring-hydroxylating dioxygenase large terminal subunit
MFINQTQLTHLLRPDQYFSEEQHRAELSALFRPAWHVIGTTHDLPKPGDFRTLELCEQPVLVRNMDGEIRAFLNVCPHRHCRITSRARGSMPQLRCQYHGWEFTKDGRTGRIPEAGAFRPFDRENACLRSFRVARCGELLFVGLAADGPSLQEFLSPLYADWATSFGGDFRFAGYWEEDFPCNWKVVLENSLESYHIPCIHQKTFGDYPPESSCAHVLDERYTTFRTRLEDHWVNRRQSWIVRRLGGEVTNYYEHQNIHPHLTYAGLDVNRMAFAVYPTSPTTCRYCVWIFTLRGRRRGPFAWLLARILQGIVRHVATQVLREDGGIYPAVQQGLQASPHRGVIGTREERVYVFQKYVIDRVSAPRVSLPVHDGAGSPCAAR